MSKRKIRGTALLEFQERYGQMQGYTRILFDDEETQLHYKIKIPEAIYGQLAKMLRTMYNMNVPTSEAEAHKYIDCVMQALHNVAHTPKGVQVTATPLINIQEELAKKQ